MLIDVHFSKIASSSFIDRLQTASISLLHAGWAPHHWCASFFKMEYYLPLLQSEHRLVWICPTMTTSQLSVVGIRGWKDVYIQSCNTLTDNWLVGIAGQYQAYMSNLVITLPRYISFIYSFPFFWKFLKWACFKIIVKHVGLNWLSFCSWDMSLDDCTWIWRA